MILYSPNSSEHLLEHIIKEVKPVFVNPGAATTPGVNGIQMGLSEISFNWLQKMTDIF